MSTGHHHPPRTQSTIHIGWSLEKLRDSIRVESYIRAHMENICWWSNNSSIHHRIHIHTLIYAHGRPKHGRWVMQAGRQEKWQKIK